MATKTKQLDARVTSVLEAMKSKGLAGEQVKWDWTSMRTVLISTMMRAVEAECPFDKDADGQKSKAAVLKAWTELLSDGYMVESSNFGKTAAELGYAMKTVPGKTATTAVEAL